MNSDLAFLKVVYVLCLIKIIVSNSTITAVYWLVAQNQGPVAVEPFLDYVGAHMIKIISNKKN